MNVAVGVKNVATGARLFQVFVAGERPTDRRAFVWANMMQDLAPTETLEFRFFAVGDLDDRDAVEFVRREYGWAPW